MEQKFDWLNEAVTEELALRMSGYESPIYDTEVKLLYFLCTGGRKGIDPGVFERAYHEQYDPTIITEVGNSTRRVGVPHWKVMWRSVEESFGPGYLNRLDKIVREKGPEYGLEQAQAGNV